MKFFVAVTDNDWFRFLSELDAPDEVNFWRPRGPRAFRALDPGELFLFKLHSPQNYVVGGGTYTYCPPSGLPVSLAWEAFGEKNGAPSFERMLGDIAKYRDPDDPGQRDYDIGCIILTNPFFFEPDEWIPAPEDFPNNVPAKGYTLETETGRRLWDQVQERLQRLSARRLDEGEEDATVEYPEWAEHGGRVRPSLPFPSQPDPHQPLYGDPILVRPRLGQGSFRVLVTDTYQRRCAITGEKALPALEAAHIKPVSKSGQHRIDNGLLFRADIHKLFDRGYVTVTPDHRFLVSRRLKDDFDNGEPYYPLDGKELWLPPHEEQRPSPEYLEWHADSVFQR